VTLFSRILERKPFFTFPKKFVVFIQKAVERKRNTFEIKFLFKKMSIIRKTFQK